MIVSFEGGIGSGKSTVMEKVRQHFEENVDKKKCIITEDVDVWKNEGWLDTTRIPSDMRWDFSCVY
jgi:uridine kinase